MNDTVLQVQGLCKNYPAFTLSEVSFSQEAGRIMGFIGRNGAGKTTTLKSILGLVHPDAGEIRYFGLPFAQNEQRIKEQIGYAAGGTSYYQRRRVGEIARMTASFYPGWDDAAYRNYLRRFSLDESKCLRELSEGMKVKFLLTLALSHHAKLLLLDEPTSGLDPVSREELLEIFLRLAEEGVAILFSTHITSDLEKCAEKGRNSGHWAHRGISAELPADPPAGRADRRTAGGGAGPLPRKGRRHPAHPPGEDPAV